MAQNETLSVSDAMFIGGMDSFSLPNYLGQGEIVASMNTVCRGGIVQTRPGAASLYSIPGLNIQGFTGFTPASGVPHHAIAIDGLIYVSPAPFNSFRRLDALRFSISSKFICFESCLKSTDYTADGELYFVDKPYNVLMIQDGATRAAFWDGSVARHLNPTPSSSFDASGERITQPGFDETYIGLWMKWSGNRLWVSRNGMLFASDIGNPLKFTEAQYLNEGRAFYLPGECTGMIETPEQDGLIVFTLDNGTLFQTNIQDRTVWLSTPNFQKIVFSNIGCAAPLSLVKQYGLIWWFSPMGLINSDQAFSLNRSSRIDIQDNEMMCSKANMGPDISGVCTISYENYLLCSVPSGDKYNRHTWCLDQAVFEGPLNAWNSYWTGWRPVQWATQKVGGQQRVFFASKDHNGCLRVWEANQPDRQDNDAPITCFAQFRQNAFGRPEQLKRFAWAELNLQEVLGDVSLMVAVGGRKGAFTRVLTKELAATEGGIYADSIYDVNSCIYGHRPQTRIVRTQENVAPGLCNRGGIESPHPNDVDLNFGLLAVWSGRMGIAGYLAQAVIFEDQAAGNCEADEANPNSLSEQGCSDHNYSVNTCPFPLFHGTGSAEYTCPVNAAVISEVGTSTSVISQVDADRKAYWTAYNNARQWCQECVFPAWRNARQRFTAFCAGVSGISKTVVIPAGEYSSMVSQADANAQAYAAAQSRAQGGLVCPEPVCSYSPITSYPDSSEAWKNFVVQLTQGGDIEDNNLEYGALSPDAKRVVLGRFRSLLGPFVQTQVIDSSVRPESPYLSQWTGVDDLTLPDSRYYNPQYSDQHPLVARGYDFIGRALDPDLSGGSNFTWRQSDYDNPEIAVGVSMWISFSGNGSSRIGVLEDASRIIRCDGETDFSAEDASFHELNYCGDRCLGSNGSDLGFWQKTSPGVWEFTAIGRLPEWGVVGEYGLSVNKISGDGTIFYGEHIDSVNEVYYLVRWVNNVPTEVVKDQGFSADLISEDGLTVCTRLIDGTNTMWDQVNGWRDLGTLIRAITPLVPANASWFDEPFEGSYSQELVGISGNSKFFLVRVVGPNFDEVAPLMYVCLGDASGATSFLVSSADDGLNGLSGSYFVWAISGGDRILLGEVEIPLSSEVDITALINSSPITEIPGASRRVFLTAETEFSTERMSTTDDNLSVSPVTQEFIDLLGGMTPYPGLAPQNEGNYGVIDIPVFNGCEVRLRYYLPPPG